MKTSALAVALSCLAAAASAQNVSGPPVAPAPSLPGGMVGGAAAPAMPGAPAAGMMAPGVSTPGAAAPGVTAPGVTSGLPGTTATPATSAIPGSAAATAGITGIGGVITASGGRIYQTQKAGDPTQGFVKLKNESSTADELLTSACPIADSTALVDAQGKPAGKLKLEPGKSLILSPTGPHLTLKGTHFQITNGSIVPCTLTFQNAGQIQVMLGWEKPPKK